MKVSIDVTSRIEGDAIKAALEDPATRTTTMLNGMLLLLPVPARHRVIQSFLNTWAPVLEPMLREQQRGLFRLHDADGTSGE